MSELQALLDRLELFNKELDNLIEIKATEYPDLESSQKNLIEIITFLKVNHKEIWNLIENVSHPYEVKIAGLDDLKNQIILKFSEMIWKDQVFRKDPSEGRCKHYYDELKKILDDKN